MRKSRTRVNYVDFILAGLIILILATLITMFFSKSAIVDITSKDTVIVSLKIDNIQSNHNDLINQNDKVFIGDDDIVFGEIKTIKYHRAALFLEPKSDKVLHPIAIRNSDVYGEDYLYTAIIEIECQGLANGTEFEINNKTFQIKDVLDFCTANFSAKASIINFYKE